MLRERASVMITRYEWAITASDPLKRRYNLRRALEAKARFLTALAEAEAEFRRVPEDDPDGL